MTTFHNMWNDFACDRLKKRLAPGVKNGGTIFKDLQRRDGLSPAWLGAACAREALRDRPMFVWTAGSNAASCSPGDRAGMWPKGLIWPRQETQTILTMLDLPDRTAPVRLKAKEGRFCQNKMVLFCTSATC